MLEDLAEGLDIRLKWVVNSVDYSDKKLIKLTSTTGQTVYASKVVVTTSLGVLKSGMDYDACY